MKPFKSDFERIDKIIGKRVMNDEGKDLKGAARSLILGYYNSIRMGKVRKSRNILHKIASNLTEIRTEYFTSIIYVAAMKLIITATDSPLLFLSRCSVIHRFIFHQPHFMIV
jgi:hypothetical protein